MATEKMNFFRNPMALAVVLACVLGLVAVASLKLSPIYEGNGERVLHMSNGGEKEAPLAGAESSRELSYEWMVTRKTAFQNEYPLAAEFRSGPRNQKRNYRDWVDQQLMPGGNALDIQTNMLRLEPGNWGYANRFAKENPGTTILSTWRAAGGVPEGAYNPGDPLGSSTISFPGHWVTAPGTMLSQSIFAYSTTLPVVSTQNLEKGPALLVGVDNFGNELWDQFEYVLITSVGTGFINVRRQYNGSPPARAFSWSTSIRPLPWDSRSRTDYIVWFFNYSKYCPRDRFGQTAADIIARDMLDPLKPGGPLDRISGIDLASGPLTVPPDNADYDRDGRVDSDSVYYEGVETFYRRIRAVLGPDRFLTTSIDYSYLGLINGVNQEGLAEPDDPWDEVSETVNEVLAWRKLSPLPMISIAFQQHYAGNDKYLRVQLQRLLDGYSACLGMASDIETGGKDKNIDGIDFLNLIELYKGDAMEPRWLGRAVSMKRTALMTPNILGNAQSNTDWSRIIPALSVKRGSLSVQGNEMVLTPQSGSSGYVTLDLDFFLPNKSDFTVLMEVISDDDQIERRVLLPRVNVSTDTKGNRAKFTSKDYVPLTFLFRGASPGAVTIDFRFGKGGPIRFKALSVHAATDGLACEFERGVVVVNPSLEDEVFDFTRLFPNRRGFRRLSAPETFAAHGGDVDAEFQPQLQQAMQINNGQFITNTRAVPVLERNALFLIADSVTAVSGSLEVNGFELSSTGTPPPGPPPTRRPTRKPTSQPTRRPSQNAPTGRPTTRVVKSTRYPTQRPTLRPTRLTPRPTPRPTPLPLRPPTPAPVSAPTPNNSEHTLAKVCRPGGSCGTLQKCQGDCSSDNDCAGDLLCFQRNKRTIRTISGCDGKAKGGLDYCVDKNDYPEALHPHISAKASDYKNNIFARPPVSRPTPARPPTPQGNFSGTLVKVCSQSKGPCRILQKCEGDCDNDAHCAGGLVCFQRRKKDSRTVPTCNGLAEGGTDYCVDENDFFNKRK